jgi:hypothetical protein
MADFSSNGSYVIATVNDNSGSVSGSNLLSNLSVIAANSIFEHAVVDTIGKETAAAISTAKRPSRGQLFPRFVR